MQKVDEQGHAHCTQYANTHLATGDVFSEGFMIKQDKVCKEDREATGW